MAIMPIFRRGGMATIIDFPAGSESGQRLKLLQLASGTLPVGAFTYSQGLEMAVECGWVNSASSLREWIADVLHNSVAAVDVPVFLRLFNAFDSGDLDRADHWTAVLLACRETREQQEEERQRGRAFARLLPDIEPGVAPEILRHVRDSQTAGQAWLCRQWGIAPVAAMETFVWGWMENLVLAGVKLIPLGQSDGQRLILQLGEQIPERVAYGFALGDDDIGSGCMAQSIASSLHETQYTRLFRS